jgi:hypothetical protein
MRAERLQIMLSPKSLRRWIFPVSSMPSRAAAVRELFRLGLAAAKSSIAAQGAKSSD